MVRLTTKYDSTHIYQDSELEQPVGRVYYMRGDEAYARSTDSVLSLITNWTNREDDIHGVRIGVKYNILRSLGTSTAYLMDGDVELDQYTWTDDSTETTIGTSSSGGYILSYDVPHDLWLKYKGNSQCIGSKSRHIPFQYDIPTKHKTVISFEGTPSEVVHNGDVDVTLTVTVNDETPSSVQSRDILFYVDGELLDEPLTTDSSGVATITLEDLEDGYHTLTAHIDDDTDIYHATESYTVYVGLATILTISDYPNLFVNGVDNTVKVSARTEKDAPISDITVTLNGSTATTDVNGIATFTFDSMTTGSYTATGNDSESEAVTFNAVTVTSITGSYDDGIASPNGNEQVRFTVNGDVTASQLDGTLKHISPAGVTTNYVKKTNDDGVVVTNIHCSDYGTHNVRYELGGVNSDYLDIIRPYQYWVTDSTKSAYSPSLTNATITLKSGGYLFKKGSSSSSPVIKLPFKSNTTNFKLEFYVSNLDGDADPKLTVYFNSDSDDNKINPTSLNLFTIYKLKVTIEKIGDTITITRGNITNTYTHSSTFTSSSKLLLRISGFTSMYINDLIFYPLPDTVGE